MKNVIVLCTGNSFRSQMAEGFLKQFSGTNAKIYSGGVKANGRITEKAIFLMKEEGIDITNHTSNQVDEFLDIPFDYVITVCDNAKARCPIFPKLKGEQLHQTFPDPERLEDQDELEFIKSLRPVRDAIKEYCQKFVEDKIL